MSLRQSKLVNKIPTFLRIVEDHNTLQKVVLMHAMLAFTSHRISLDKDLFITYIFLDVVNIWEIGNMYVSMIHCIRAFIPYRHEINLAAKQIVDDQVVGISTSSAAC